MHRSSAEGKEARQRRPPAWRGSASAAAGRPRVRFSPLLCSLLLAYYTASMSGISIQNLTVNAQKLEVLTGLQGSPPNQEDEQGGLAATSSSAAGQGSAPATPQAPAERSDGGGGGTAQLTWRLLGGTPPLPPSGAAAEPPKGEGSQPYWDDSGPRQPELKQDSPEWRLHRTPSKVSSRAEGSRDQMIGDGVGSGPSEHFLSPHASMRTPHACSRGQTAVPQSSSSMRRVLVTGASRHLTGGASILSNLALCTRCCAG